MQAELYNSRSLLQSYSRFLNEFTEETSTTLAGIAWRYIHSFWLKTNWSAKTDLYFESELLVVLFKLSVLLESRQQRLLLCLKSTNVVDRASEYWAFVPATTFSARTHTQQVPVTLFAGAARHGFESEGDNFASGASQKKIFWPPTFWPVAGQNIA